jgi:WD40 repeat protein
MRNRTVFAVSFFATILYFTFSGSAQSLPYINLALQVSPDGETIAVGTINGELILYDNTYGDVLHTFQNEIGIYDLKWSPDGERIAAVNYFGNLKVWDIGSLDLIVSIDLPLNSVFRVSWSPDGSQLAITSAETGTRVVSAITGNELYYLQTGDTADSLWSPSPNLITAGLVGLRVWQNQNEVNRILGTVNGVVNDNLPSRIAVSSRADLIAVYGVTPPEIDNVGNVSDIGNVLQIYTFPSLDLLHSIEDILPSQVAVMRLEWAENGEHIAISTTDGYIRMLDSSLNLVDEIFVDNAGWAFDWLTHSEIIFAPNSGGLTIVPVAIPVTLDLTHIDDAARRRGCAPVGLRAAVYAGCVTQHGLRSR